MVTVYRKPQSVRDRDRESHRQSLTLCQWWWTLWREKWVTHPFSPSKCLSKRSKVPLTKKETLTVRVIPCRILWCVHTARHRHRFYLYRHWHRHQHNGFETQLHRCRCQRRCRCRAVWTRHKRSLSSWTHTRNWELRELVLISPPRLVGLSMSDVTKMRPPVCDLDPFFCRSSWNSR